MALFKIYNNIDSNNNKLPEECHKGYMYFDINTKLFWIDIADGIIEKDEVTGESNEKNLRVPLNSWGATKAYADEQGSRIISTYMKKSDLHTLTFGNGGQYVYDGSEDVTVPVYTGDYTIS